MATFQFEAMNSSGQEVKDEVEASDSQDAIAKIRQKGYFPTKVREKTAKKTVKKKAKDTNAGPTRKMPMSIGGVPRKQLVAFTRQLSTLQDAGLPILRSLQILEQQQKPGLLKAIVGGVADEVEGGGTLSDAMSKYPKAFDKLYVNMINAGEAGGVLDLILARLADFMEKAAKLKKKVIGAMIYPAVVIFIAVAIVSMIMIFVIPKFEEIFLDFKLKLPAPTQLLMDISHFMAPPTHGWAYLLAAPFVMFGLIRLIKMSEGGKYAVDVIKLKIPILGAILSKTAVARFTRTLGTLISAGVPILDAINITKETSGNEVFARALGKVHDAIREGESMADPLRATKVVDSIVVNMVDVGEETGDLDKMLMKIADNYDNDVDVLVGSLISILEPVMVVVLGIIVGYIVISLFMPMITLIQGMTSAGSKK
ncbi:MAG: Type II secretory pathway, component PulF / Type IV fimbrial assembly protein PilC [uncultured Phycisphaerae bacterium]|uniref:Type II secretory pathway, component PulF / Type IV fimbrial assembly protein PilC n=1 Tax=uncultured Phycisphaerae bacterium TaxID=904963 RepID=A0A6J4NL46_9BACT|nr:MAG: Type II secretory pathway, component PulF / Type IV fimbrial assembly protein PilC [uncultured Phycisphaerae bacterium]